MKSPINHSIDLPQNGRGTGSCSGFTIIQTILVLATATLCTNATASGQVFHLLEANHCSTPKLLRVGEPVTTVFSIINGDNNNSVGDAIIVTNIYQLVFPYAPTTADCLLPITNIIDLAPFSSNNIVTNADIGGNQIIFGINLPSLNSGVLLASTWTPSCAPVCNVIRDLVVVEAMDTHSQDAFPVPLSWSVTSADLMRVVPGPCISSSAFSTNPPGQKSIVEFTGTISNCGCTPLTLFVEQSQPTNQTPVLGPVVLQAGTSMNFSGSYPPSSDGSANLITVRGTELPVGQSALLSVTNTSTVIASPVLTPILQGSNFDFSFPTESTRMYKVEFTDSLSPPVWQTLTNISGDGGVATVRDVTTNSSRFFRLTIQ